MDAVSKEKKVSKEMSVGRVLTHFITTFKIKCLAYFWLNGFGKASFVRGIRHSTIGRELSSICFKRKKEIFVVVVVGPHDERLKTSVTS